MIKKLSSIASFVMIASITILTSACSFLPKYSDPESIDIDGETYMTGFYENLWVEGIVFSEDDIPNFETKYHIWWKVENAPFDMYCAQNKEALWWNPAIYCKKSYSMMLNAMNMAKAESGLSDYSGVFSNDSTAQRSDRTAQKVLKYMKVW